MLLRQQKLNELRRIPNKNGIVICKISKVHNSWAHSVNISEDNFLFTEISVYTTRLKKKRVNNTCTQLNTKTDTDGVLSEVEEEEVSFVSSGSLL